MTKEENMVTWRLPDWAAIEIIETLEMDGRSSAFDPDLRDEINKARGAIEEIEGGPSLPELDRLTRILHDLKKHISYDKSNGERAWVDNDRMNSLADYHTGFKTWLDAAKDAVEPYINEKGLVDQE